MIDLTEQQVLSLEHVEAAPPRVRNPKTQETFVLLTVAEYERLTSDYDDSPWTDEELELLAWQAGARAGWEDMDEYDNYPEKQ